MNARCEHTQDVAAWTLGALDSEEAERLTAHLEGCGICQAEAEELTPAAEVLAMAAVQMTPPDALRDRVMQTVRAESRLLAATSPAADRPRDSRSRWRLGTITPMLAGAAACALLAAGVVAGVVIDGGEGDAPPAKTFQAKAEPGMAALATVSSDHVTLHLEGMETPPPGRVYQVWLERDGEVVPTSTLFAPSRGEATVMVEEALEGADRVMISDEPIGGSQLPTGDVYMDAQLS